MKKEKEHKIIWNDKTKSHSLPGNRNQTQTQVSRKIKYQESHRGYPATGVNITEVSKKNKDKDKD